MKTLLLLVAAYLFLCAAHAQQNIYKQKYNASKPVEDEVGYTHAVQADNTLYISGTVATGNMAAQVKSIMESISNTLSRYGATFQNVVKENVYTTNLDSFIAVKNVRKAYYNNDYPAATWVEVKRLYLPQFLVEIEVTAVLPKR